MNKRYEVILNFLLNVKEIEYKKFCMIIYIIYAIHRKDIDMYYEFDEKLHSWRLDRDVLDLLLLGAISIKKEDFVKVFELDNSGGISIKDTEIKFYLSCVKNQSKN